MQNFCLSNSLVERYKSAEKELGYSDSIVQLDCEAIDFWELGKRHTCDMGDIDELAMSIQHEEQYQPILVVRTSNEFRPKHNHFAEYVIVSGNRRWLACKTLQIKVKAIIKNMDFDQIINLLIIENKHDQISDYGKGFFFHAVLQTNKITFAELRHRLNISSDQLNDYLSFAKVPESIWRAVGNPSMVSAKASAAILDIANKGPKHIEALHNLAGKIAHGFGDRSIRSAVGKITSNKQVKNKAALDHHVKFNGKTIMNLHEGRIKLDNSLVAHQRYEELVEKLEKDVTEFVKSYFR